MEEKAKEWEVTELTSSGWIKCKQCNINLRIRDAKMNGCPKCHNKYKSTFESSPLPVIQPIVIMNINMIIDKLYLGSWSATENKDLLMKSGIKFICNVTSECKNHYPDDFEYYQKCVEDKTSFDLSSVLLDIINWIKQQLESERGSVLVHCHAGVSRSPAVVIAFLMKEKQMTLKAAYLHVRQRRRTILPNPGFLKQLHSFEKELFGTNSVTLQELHEFLT